MVKDELQDSFIKALKTKFPQRGTLANKLTEILAIEKEAVYRRLRGEVPFSLSDVVAVMSEINISAEEIFGKTPSVNRPFHFKMTDFWDMSESDYTSMEQFLEELRKLKDSPDSEIGIAYNMIPQTLCLPYEEIFRFYLFKWTFHNCSPENTKTFSEVTISPRLRAINQLLVENSHGAGNTCYIWDNMIFSNIVNDIKYFADIRLITKDEVKKLRAELLNFIDNVELITAKGYFETGKKVSFYVSNLRFESSCCYIETPSFLKTIIKSYTLNDVVSADAEVFSRTKAWISSLKRTSNMLSESAEVQRILFFDKQREIICGL